MATPAPPSDDRPSGAPSSDEGSPGHVPPEDPRRPWQLAGAGLLGLQATALVVLAVVQLVTAITGNGQVLRNELMIVVTLLIAAAGLVVVAVGVRRGRAAVRTAGVFWQVLLLAVVWFQWQAGVRLLPLVVLVVAVATAVAVVMATRGGQPRSTRP